MSSITTQQTKIDLELVPKENRLDIGKCNERIPHGLTPREPTFQVALDAIALTPCYPAFLITADFLKFCGRDFDALPSEEDTVSFLRELGHTGKINSLNDVVVDQMHQPWRTFVALIKRSLSGKTSGLDKLRLSRAQILWGMYYQKNVDYVKLLWEDFIYQIDNRRNKIGMHTSKNDYLITTLRFVSAREATQIYGAILLECLTSPKMKESKAYKTYLGYATGVIPPKIARKFKKISPAKKCSDLVPEPIKKGKRVKRPAKKSTSTPAVGIVIREAHVETKSNRKEKVDVARGKRIELLSEVSLTKEVQMKEVKKKSMRDFHRTHPSGSGTVAKKPLSVAKITPTGNDEDDNNDGNDSVSEDNEDENESDDEETQYDNKEGLDFEQDTKKNESSSKSDQDDKDEEVKDDEEVEDEFVHTPSPMDDKDDTKGDDKIEDEETIQKEGESEVPIPSLSHSSDLVSKFLNFIDIPLNDAEIVSPLDVFVHHEVPSTHASTLLTVPVSVIPESLPVFTTIQQSSHTFSLTLLLTTPTPPPTTKIANPPSTLPDFAFIL
ncbi:hypothetical protein Tco_0542384 [Tanacetum coccineum]